MTDITELAQRMKAAAVRAKAATEDYVAHRMSITVCLEECKEFNDLSDGPDNIIALVEALEKAQTDGNDYASSERAVAVKSVELQDEIYGLKARIAEMESFRAAYMEWSDKTDWVRTDRRFDFVKPLGKHLADVLKAYIEHLESCTVTIEPFRSFVTDADLAALHRFAECCDDPESGGHDLEKEQVRRLEAIGALQRSGRISYITGFGDVLISITAGIKVEGE